MKPEHDDFARRHPSLDRALREQIAAPKMDGAFRQQVFARIAAQRTELQRAAASPSRPDGGARWSSPSGLRAGGD